MLVSSEKSTILLPLFIILGNHLCRKGRTRDRESSLVAHHILSVPMWKNYYYWLYYPVLLFGVYLLTLH